MFKAGAYSMVDAVDADTSIGQCEVFFGVEQCTIRTVVAKEGFKMPGHYIDSNGIVIIGSPINRTVRKGQKLLVRLDKTYPDRIEIQLLSCKDIDVSFRLTKSQYKGIVKERIKYE